MISVQSSSLESYAYDVETHTLSIKFKRTPEIYDYADVPEDLITEFELAESKGKFFHANIRNRFNTTKRSAVLDVDATLDEATRKPDA